MDILKSVREIDYMRDAYQRVARTLVEMKDAVRPEICTCEIDKIAEKYIRNAGCVSAFKNYDGFPSAICRLINQKVVHGTPSLKKLKNGDIISIDVGAVTNGFNGDSAKAFLVGAVSSKLHQLLKVTDYALSNGIEKVMGRKQFINNSHTIQIHGESDGYGIVRDYVGHGIGKKMHENPQIPNYGSTSRDPRLKSGMTLAIEPMIELETHDAKTLNDNDNIFIVLKVYHRFTDISWNGISRLVIR